MHELQLQLPQLEPEIQLKHPSTPLNQLIFETDYVSIPMKVKWHHRIDTIQFSSEEEEAALRDLVLEAQKDDIVVRSVVQWGESTRIIPLLVNRGQANPIPQTLGRAWYSV